MLWHISNRADKRALPIADRHYNRQKIGSPQFVPPGRCLVLLTENADALWVTSWPFAEYVKHAWAGAWVCSCFRNESGHTASELIRQAVAATVAYYGPAPELGMISFIDTKKVQPTMVRGKKTFGWTYKKAGWKLAACPKHPGGAMEGCKACQSRTHAGLMALQLPKSDMPEPIHANGHKPAEATMMLF